MAEDYRFKNILQTTDEENNDQAVIVGNQFGDNSDTFNILQASDNTNGRRRRNKDFRHIVIIILVSLALLIALAALLLSCIIWKRQVAQTGKFSEMNALINVQLERSINKDSPQEYSFTVYRRSEWKHFSFQQKEKFPFNESVTNPGSYFNLTEHVYLVPESGLYYFIVCICMGQLGGGYSRSANFVLMKEDVEVFHLYSFNNDGENYIYDQGCNAVVKRCEKNDRLWVEAKYDSRYVSFRDSMVSSFTGILLYKDSL